MAALTITADGTQTIVDATGSSGVAYLSGVQGGASVSIGVTMSNAITVPLTDDILNHGSNPEGLVVAHGTGATLVAVTTGASGTTNLTLDFYPL